MSASYDPHDPKYDDLYTEAPTGQLYVCTACGKTSRNKIGETRERVPVANLGWDESCFLHAVLCYEQKGSDGLYRPVPPPQPKFEMGDPTK